MKEQFALGAALQLNTSAAAQALMQMTTGAQAAAKAQAALAAAAAGVKKALTNLISGFDELHIAKQDDPAKGAAAKKGSSAKKGSGSAKKGSKEEAEALLQEEEAAWVKWLRAYLANELAPSVQAWRDAFSQIRTAADEAFARVSQSALGLWQNALAPLGQYIVFDFIPAVVNGFSTAFAPIFADISAMLLDVFATGFETACRIAESAVNTILTPTLELVKTIFTDMFAAVQSTWEAYGVPLIAGLTTAFEGIFALIEALYTTVIQPVLQSLVETLTSLWNEHLAPLWKNLLEFFASTGDAILTLWNEVLQPLLGFLIDTFGPILAELGAGIAEVFGDVAGTVADVIFGILGILKDLCSFLKNVFTGNWKGAWEDVKSIFGGIWDTITGLLKNAINGIIKCINVMTRGVAAAINGVVGAVNSIRFTVPSWVPGIGGSSLGFSLPTVSAPQIPYLAKGAVIPPNGEFLAMLGDQRHGRNLEAPEALIRQIVREESGSAQRFTADQPVQLALDGDVFYKAMMKIRAQRGAQIGGGFADVI